MPSDEYVMLFEGMKAIAVAVTAITTTIRNHKRVRLDMRAPCLYAKNSPAGEAGATYKRARL
jgi:predicted transcriptional regulator